MIDLIAAAAALEPAALDQLPGTTPRICVTDEEIALSQAISLKRIADALTGQGESILTTPINCYGEGIGEAIQGQMVRGAAGISQYDR